MKTILALIILMFTAPVLADPASEGAFYDPDSKVFGEGVSITTSLSGRISFIFYTTMNDCDVKILEECYSERRDFTSGLNPVIDGQSQGSLSTIFNGASHQVGWYIMDETNTGYALDIVCAGGSPIACEHRVFNTLYDFSSCIVSGDKACLD